MPKHFIKYINIERYKCFGDFSAEGLKRVNLISGKNNVGKSALLEAIVININSITAQSLIDSLDTIYNLRSALDDENKTDYQRKSDYITNQAGSVKTATNINSISFDNSYTDAAKDYKIATNDDFLTIPESRLDINSILKNIPEPDKKVCFISSMGSSQDLMIRSFSAIQKKNKEAELIEVISSFDDSIKEIRLTDNSTIECKVVQPDGSFSFQNINDCGDGLRHYLEIIADLFYAENCYLLIDNLGSGIHYSSLDKMWETILKLSDDNNVQVFATTHSKECIESYYRVAKKLNDTDISFITLIRNKDKVVKAITRDYELFASSINDGHEVRGW